MSVKVGSGTRSRLRPSGLARSGLRVTADDREVVVRITDDGELHHDGAVFVMALPAASPPNSSSAGGRAAAGADGETGDGGGVADAGAHRCSDGLRG